MVKEANDQFGAAFWIASDDCLVPEEVNGRSRGRHAADLTRGVTVFGDLRAIVTRLRLLDVPMSAIEFLPMCEYALYVKPGIVTPEQSVVLRMDFQVATGRC